MAPGLGNAVSRMLQPLCRFLRWLYLMAAKWLPRLHVPCPRVTYPEQAGGDGLAPPQALPTCIRDKALSHKPPAPRGFLSHLIALATQF